MKIAIIAINALLAAGAIYLGAGIYRQWERGTGTGMDQPVAGQVGGGAVPKPGPDRSRARYNAVVARDLFGTAKSDQSGINTVQLDRLKPTVLKLKLWGTVTGDQETYAVIEDLKTRQQVLYHVGDSVQNATIKMILRDKVVISAGGKDEIIPLEEATGGAGPGPGKMPETPPGMAVAPEVPEPGEPPEAQPQAPSAPMADKQMTGVNVSPQLEDGEVSGLRINRLTPDSILRRMGLKPGDVITGVNEQPVTQPEEVRGIFEHLDGSGQVQIQIRRQGQQQTIDFKK